MNNYNLTEEIGRGKYSIVYKGRKKKSIQYFAVKSVEKSHREKVLNEVSIMHKLNHTNILKFYDWYETPNHLWLIVEYCTGGDLLNVLKQDGRIPECTIQMFSRDILSGLQQHSKTGTPAYMAAEMFTEEGIPSFASDLWAFGCVLFELSSGSPPFYSNSFQEIASLALYSSTPVLKDCSAQLNDLLNKLLKKDPSERLSWKKLIGHSFWNFQLPEVLLPHQPHFEEYLQKRKVKLDSGNFDSKDESEIKNLSLLASRNMAREADNDYLISQRKATESGDVVLNNPDTELNFDDSKQSNATKHTEESVPFTSDEKSIEEFEEPEKFALNHNNGNSALSTPKAANKHELNLKAITASTSTTIDDDSSETLISPKRRIQSAPVKQTRTEFPKPQLRPLTGLRISPIAVPPTVVTPTKNGTLSPTNSDKEKNLSVMVKKLIFHSADKVVKPIVESTAVEISDVKFPQKAPPFELIPLTKMMQLPQKELEFFLTAIYNAITEKGIVAQKLAYLDYFETLCVETKSANIIINSSLLSLFVRIIESGKSAALRAKLAHVIGVLIRHATMIAKGVKDANLINLLIEMMKDKEAEVRRASISCLGELMFYIATQEKQHDWAIPTPLVTLLVKSLKSGEDEIVQQYCTQTIGNISTASTSYSKLFCSLEIAFSLFEIFATTKREPLRVASAVTLCRICKQLPPILHQMIEKMEAKVITDNLADGNSKVQQAFLNMLNMALSEGPSRIQQALIEEKGLIKNLKKLLEHAQSIIRGKALLALHFLIKLDTRLFLLCCQNKILPILERISRDKETYVRHCSKVAMQSILDLVPTITQQITSEIRKIGERNRPSPQSLKVLKEHLKNFPVLLHLMTSAFLRSRIFNQNLIKELSFYLSHIEELTFLTPEEFKNTLLLILEAISQNSSILSGQHQDIIQYLLPSLISLLKSENGDTRFLCLKIFIDAFSELVSQSHIYNTTQETIATKIINDLILKQLLPNFKKILTDEDPIPSYGLKLLNLILEKNSAFIVMIQKHGLISFFLKFFTLDHPNNNTHNIKLIKKLVESSELDKRIFYEQGIVQKISASVVSSFENSVDSFLEPLLDIIHSLLFYASKHSEFAIHNQQLVDQTGIFIRLLSHPDSQVSEKSGRVLNLICTIYGFASELVLSKTNISHLISALNNGNSTAQKQILHTLTHIAASHSQLISKESELQRVLKTLKGEKMALLAKEILRKVS